MYNQKKEVALQVQQGLCHILALPFTLKMYLTTKEDLWKTQIFYHAKI